MKGDLRAVLCLLDKGASVNLSFKKGRTALMEACRGGKDQIAIALLKKGVNVDMQDDRGKTALMYAAFKGHEPIVTALLSHNAKLELADQDQKTALMIAFDNSHENIVAVIEKIVCDKYFATCEKYGICDGPSADLCKQKSRLAGTTRFTGSINT
jgi:ankyrin repeat protein